MSSEATGEEILSLHELDPILSRCINLGTSRARARTVASPVHSNNVVCCRAVIENCKINKQELIIISSTEFIYYSDKFHGFLLTKYITGFETFSFRPAGDIEGPATRASDRVGRCMSHVKMEQHHAQHGCDGHRHCTASSLNHFLRDEVDWIILARLLVEGYFLSWSCSCPLLKGACLLVGLVSIFALKITTVGQRRK